MGSAWVKRTLRKKGDCAHEDHGGGSMQASRIAWLFMWNQVNPNGLGLALTPTWVKAMLRSFPV